MTNNAEARAREVLAEAIEADVIAFPSYATKRMAYYVRGTQAAQIWSGTVLRAMLAYGNERAAQEREANAAELEQRAELARVAAIGGGMDPSDASLIDYEMSNAATAIRARGAA